MNASERINILERKVRLLRNVMLLGGTSALILVAAGLGWQGGHPRFDVIDVERINIRESDGRLALVLSNAARLPGPITGGREYPAEMSEGRVRSSGILFYNHEGNEAGGLVYGSSQTAYGPQGAGSLTFDRMNQDQTVQLTHWDGTQRFSGLNVWDRPDLDVAELLEAIVARQEGRMGAEEFRSVATPHVDGTAHRLRLGSANRVALMELKDTRGRTRIRLAVDSLNVPSIEILDETGAVQVRLPQ